MNFHTDDVTVEAYVRPAQLLEPCDAKIGTLRRLESTDRIEELTLHTWPEKIALAEQTPYTEAVDAFERMKAWADEHDVDVQPPFSVRTTTSSYTGETRTVLRTPVMCLAVHVDGRLANVFPHSRGEDTYGVVDAIAALRTGELEMFTFDPGRLAAPPDRCPACETLLTNVQGIGVCQNCDRVELGAPTRERRRDSLAGRP